MSQEKSAARLLEDLTPGGSEFYNDPEYCFNFIKEQLQSLPSQVLPFKKENDKLKWQNSSALDALKACYNLFQAEYEDLSDQGKRVRKQVMEVIQKAT